MNSYYIGDIHGCHAELVTMINKLNLQASDKVYFAGDLVNRGPESLETLRFVKSLENASMVLGNHDLYLLACYYNEIPSDYMHTFHRVMAADDCGEIMQWLIQQPLHYKHDDTLLVHAGLYPGWSVDQAIELSNEVSDFMRANPCEFFHSMFGQDPINWEQTNGREQRHRFIINAFTRMRYVDNNGVLDFASHKPPPHPNKSIRPWFQKKRELTIVFGHWSALGGYSPVDHVIALDGGCVWGNKLLAWEQNNDVWHEVLCLRN